MNLATPAAGIAPDRFTYNALLEAHAAADDLEGVASVYKAMLGCGVQPDICTFVALFQVDHSLTTQQPYVWTTQDQLSLSSGV